ncbi:MAG: DUF1294 domain-containing protein [Caldilineaceae bacterium]
MSANNSGRSPQTTFSIVALVAVAAIVLALVWFFDWGLFPVWLVAVNVITFFLYRYDKGRAQVEGATRVPEVVLLGLTWAGGVLGAAGGMYMQPRHKTQKNTFVITLVLAALLHGALLIWWFLR